MPHINLWGGAYTYKITMGGTSDLRVWSKAGIPSVNLSIGYYNEHTPDEYLNLDEWHRTQDRRLQCYRNVVNKISTREAKPGKRI